MNRSQVRRAGLIIGFSLLGLVPLLFILDIALDRPIRWQMESRMNAALVGYSARIENVDFHVFGGSLDVEGMQIVQDAHPDPPVALFPRLNASLQWKALLFGRLVADFQLDHPVLRIDLRQLTEESRDEVDVDDRGWQDAIEAIYPFKVNELRINGGEMVYVDTDPDRPLHLRRVNVVARNLRNVRAPGRKYPSDVHLDAIVFDRGGLLITGNADFLARPHPGVKGHIWLDDMELGYFGPIVERYQLVTDRGTLTAFGNFEYSDDFKIFDLEDVLIEGTRVEYVQSTQTPLPEEKVARDLVEAADKLKDHPRIVTRVRKLRILDSTFSVANKAESPAYRVYWSDIDLVVENFSNQQDQGPAVGRLTGRFMGSGATRATATFLPASQSPDLDLALSITDTQMTQMNDMFRAHGNFDVVEGLFSFYSKVRIRDGVINGYVKPLFRDVNVYDARQDRDKNVFRKMWEGIVGGLAKLFTNRARDEVATRADISGRVSDPEADTLQIVFGLVRNAFFRSILPGLDEEISNPRNRGRDRERPPRRV